MARPASFSLLAQGERSDEKVPCPVHGQRGRVREDDAKLHSGAEKKGMEAWMKWMGDNKASLVEGGAPRKNQAGRRERGLGHEKQHRRLFRRAGQLGRRGDEDYRQGPSPPANAGRLGGGHRDHAGPRDMKGVTDRRPIGDAILERGKPSRSDRMPRIKSWLGPGDVEGESANS